MIDTVLDRRYKIIQIIAEGGFGQTYLAKDLKRPGNPLCVVKQLKPQNTDPNILNKAKELFKREAEILEELGKHAQIPQLFTYEEAEFYLVQEYILGHTLAEELEREQTLPELQIINLISELLEILAFVHSKNVIHRDVKPQNIIISEPEQKLVLIDFGAVKQIADLNYPATLIGTPGYAAPEQMYGTPDYSSDLYAVGIIGIQAFIGTNPNFSMYENNSNQSNKITWQKQIKTSQELVDFLDKLVRHDRQERYQSAQEAIAALQEITKITSFPKNTNINSDLARNILSSKIIKSANKIIAEKLLYILTPTFLIILGFLVITKWQNNKLDSSSLVSNKTINSTLGFQDTCNDLSAKFYCKKYNFIGQKERQIEIQMDSESFDSYLVLITPEGKKLQVNEDISPNNWNAKIMGAIAKILLTQIPPPKAMCHKKFNLFAIAVLIELLVNMLIIL